MKSRLISSWLELQRLSLATCEKVGNEWWIPPRGLGTGLYPVGRYLFINAWQSAQYLSATIRATLTSPIQFTQSGLLFGLYGSFSSVVRA